MYALLDKPFDEYYRHYRKLLLINARIKVPKQLAVTTHLRLDGPKYPPPPVLRREPVWRLLLAKRKVAPQFVLKTRPFFS